MLAVVAVLYVQQALGYFSARSQADQQLSIVKSLARQNSALRKQAKVLNDPTTIIREARALGMVRPGERPYVVLGLPGH